MAESPSRERYLKVAKIVTSRRIGPLDGRATWMRFVEAWEAGEDVSPGLYRQACAALKLDAHPHGERHHTINRAA